MQCVSLRFAYLRELTYKWCAIIFELKDLKIQGLKDFLILKT
jgi:hypothetical protein